MTAKNVAKQEGLAESGYRIGEWVSYYYKV